MLGIGGPIDQVICQLKPLLFQKLQDPTCRRLGEADVYVGSRSLIRCPSAF